MSTSISVNIRGENHPRIECATYDDYSPILSIATEGSCYLTISTARHKDLTVTEEDLAAARSLLAAAQTFLDELVAKHAAQAGPVAVGA